jgi:deazaflavin-dependent oxidoreductase (nitroreductase family)
MTEKAHPPAYRPVDIGLLGDEHVRVYRETDGEQGYLWNGAPILLLTSKGRKTGQMRTIPIIFTPVGDGWAIIASKGGSPTHPAWYLNVTDDPNVRVQVKGEVHEAVARTADSPVREEIWA